MTFTEKKISENNLSKIIMILTSGCGVDCLEIIDKKKKKFINFRIKYFSHIRWLNNRVHPVNIFEKTIKKYLLFRHV